MGGTISVLSAPTPRFHDLRLYGLRHVHDSLGEGGSRGEGGLTFDFRPWAFRPRESPPRLRLNPADSTRGQNRVL
jgi:hypothetical protein